MAKICLVSCVRTKLDRRARAEELYVSPLFKKAKDYAKTNSERWFVLSAKYGLVRPEQQIEPYEMTLKRMSSLERIQWAKGVLKNLLAILNPGDKVIFLAGKKYREHLADNLEKHGYQVEVPLAGLSIGRQLQRLTPSSYKRY